MKKYLINFLILLMLSLNAVSASEKDYGNLTEITLKKGLNNYQSKLVAKGLADDLKQIFNFWLTESHFIYYPQCSNEENNACRQNLSFNVNFSSASVDLDNDEIDDLLVRICLLYTSPSPRDRQKSRMPSSA